MNRKQILTCPLLLGFFGILPPLSVLEVDFEVGSVVWCMTMAPELDVAHPQVGQLKTATWGPIVRLRWPWARAQKVTVSRECTLRLKRLGTGHAGRGVLAWRQFSTPSPP